MKDIVRFQFKNSTSVALAYSSLDSDFEKTTNSDFRFFFENQLYPAIFFPNDTYLQESNPYQFKTGTSIKH